MKLVYYFTADWCNPCKKTRPIVEEINRNQNNIKFHFIDADSEKEMLLNFNVKSIPTFIFIENGKEIKRLSGGQTKESLIEFINE
jgi:thioredoxin 1